MPAVLVHGWLPDAYRAAPLPVLALLAGVLSKVGAYGFLRVALPLYPQATVHYQELILLIGVASILYGSVMAFTQTNVRLIAGYSSIAQLGFITIGIFSLRPDGADGSVLQMVNHGLVVAPIFLIIALLWERSGTEDLTRLGGLAMRAPVLAALFLIVTLATLAMPGSANFIGEFYILIGVFQAKIVYAFVAVVGVVFAAFYAIRLFQRTMHNRLARGRRVARDLAARRGWCWRRSSPASSPWRSTRADPEPRPGGRAGQGRRRGLELRSRCASRSRRARRVRAGPATRRSTPGRAGELHRPPRRLRRALARDRADRRDLRRAVAGMLSEHRQRAVVSLFSLTTLATAAGLCIWQWGERKDLVAGALRLDELGLAAALIAILAAAVVVPLSWREPAAERPGEEPRHGEFQALLLSSVLGMVLLAQAQNLVSFFVAIELLSVPALRALRLGAPAPGIARVGLKYLIVGSLGSATLLYGLAFIYGGSGSTDFSGIRDGIGAGLADDPLVLIGIGLAATGLAFKISIAPFHQWTPDVYQGAPTPVTAFMAVATKVAAFCVFVRFFEVALGPAVDNWQPALAVLAAVSIVVGNIGALGQDSLKRLLGYSGIAQAGYMLVGLVAASELGVNALVFYLAAYALMNLAAFAVIVVRERETEFGDDIKAVQGLGRDRPELAWPLTISMLALAGLPATAGFMGKLYLIEAAVDADYTWLAVAIAIGTMISLAYYLRVVAAVWMRPAAEPLGPEPPPGCRRWRAARRRPTRRTPHRAPRRAAPPGTRCLAILIPAAALAAATIFFGVIPSPLVDWASNAGQALAAVHPLSRPDRTAAGCRGQAQVGSCSPNISGRRPARAKSPSITRAPSSSSFGANASRAASRTKSGTLARRVTAGSAALPRRTAARPSPIRTVQLRGPSRPRSS